ncbi:MAG: hypothetical protein OEQ13_06365 [Acidobacteriota bacterium]|nr:hypothetical protein [Acidobacteriota bacterium]
MINSARARQLACLLLALAAQLAAEALAQSEEPRVSIERVDAAEAEGASGRPLIRLIAQLEYIRDSNDNSFLDPSVWIGYRQAYAQIWTGAFTQGIEVGGYVKDRRRSAYSAYYRFRDDFDHVLEVNSEQVVRAGVVLYGGLRFIRLIPDGLEDRSLLQPAVGFDKYYGDYHFFTFRAIRDPRDDHDWSFVISNRVADRDRYLTVGLVPRTDGTIGYFVQGKWRRWRAGFGRFDRFDFTDIDRTVINVGYELEF